MQTRISVFLLLSFLLIVPKSTAYAQDNNVAAAHEKLKECVAQLKAGKAEYKFELKQCVQKCRLGPNASGAMVEQCNKAYNTYRKAAGKTVEASPQPKEKSFEIEKMIATFGVRDSGQIIKFKFLGEATELTQRAERVCIFKLPDSQWSGDSRRFQAQFNDKIRTIRKKGKNFAYLLSGISWLEDGGSTHYDCQIKHVDVVPIH